eukprot:gene34297-43995_t
MLALNCTWHATNNYRVLCMRYFTAEGSGQGRLGEDLSDPQGGGDPGGSVFRDSKPSEGTVSSGLSRSGSRHMEASDPMDIVEPLSPMPASGTSDPSAATSGTARGTVGLLLPPRDDVIKVALSLYKVQQSIYLLDFQQIEGDAFGFMQL